VIGNYAWAIIIFCIIVKLLMLPLSIKQQKNMKRTTKVQEKMKILQFKYKNDPEKLNQEMFELYKKEKINPFSGCFSAIVQIVLLLSIFYLVKSPLTYMRKLDSSTIDEVYSILKQENAVSESNYKEIDIIREIGIIENYEKEDNENSLEENNEEENEEKIVISQEDLNKIKINMDFLGIDLSKVPSQSTNDWKVYIIPVLYVIISFFSMRFVNSNQLKNKNDEKEEDPMMQANKQMSYIFPILYLTVTIFAPLGLALYWLVNSILMIIERLVLNIILKDKEENDNEIDDKEIIEISKEDTDK
jgi:YidC/Oxa1 family membrane protein insertase